MKAIAIEADQTHLESIISIEGIKKRDSLFDDKENVF
jgi:hypothetical protein